MKLDTEFYKLPLRYDPARLAEEVRQFAPEDWRRHPQGHAGNSAVSLIAINGDHTNDSVRGAMRATKHLERCPYLRQVLASFQSPMGRTRLMKIEGDADATAHIDTNYYWHHHLRIHVPIITHPKVTYLCNGKGVHMAAGETWVFNTWSTHNSINENPEPRVHLVADTVGSAWLWDTIDRAEKPYGKSPAAPATLRMVPFESHRDAAVTFETINFPVIMSPFEQADLLAWIFGELAMTKDYDRPDAVEFRLAAQRFQQDWHALWAQHADSPSGWDDFTRRKAAFEQQIAPFENRLSLPNNVDVHEIIMQAIVRPSVNTDLAVQKPSIAGGTPQISDIKSPPAPAPRRRQEKLENPFARPVFIVSSPRSGSTLLFELLARSPSVFTVGGESHGIFERIPALQPQLRGWTSNRLTAQDVNLDIAATLVDRFLSSIHDRDMKAPPFGNNIRLLEKTPKNSLRIPFLNTIFPDALFIYLYREPNENISSIMEAWKSGGFATYPDLPGWTGPRWSLVLTPGWQALNGKPLEEIALAQWLSTNQIILDDLQPLPKERWIAVSYTEILQSPQAAAERLCKFAGIAWDQKVDGALPHSRHTLTPPDPEKWKKNLPQLQHVLPRTQSLVARCHETLALHGSAIASTIDSGTGAGGVQVSWQPIANTDTETSVMPETAAQTNTTTAQQEAPMAQSPAPQPGAGAPNPNANQPLRSVHTTSLVPLLQQLGGSLLVSTYQAGKLIIVRVLDGGLNTHFRNFDSPMGMACDGHRLTLGTSHAVWNFRNQPDVGKKLPPLGRHDACFMPRNVHFTGDIRIHEIGYGTDDLWIVNTRFSCLCTLDANHSFVPRWRPKFITGLSPEDRCHLNGMAIIDGRPRYVTALGQTDGAAGWRDNKPAGGILMHVDSNEIISAGLSMPHSPRWYQDKLWVLESGKGHLSTVDQRTGKLTMVAELPGFTRGLDFCGPYAFVGLSQIRESNIFGGLPLTQRLTERICGVWVVDIRTGNIVAFLRFEGAVQEIFAVQLLQNIRFPDVVNDDVATLSNSFVLPNEALAEVQMAKS